MEGVLNIWVVLKQEKVKMHWCCDKVVDVRSILDGKIKLVLADVVLSPMMQVYEQYMIGIGRADKVKHTTSSLFVKKLFMERNIVFGFDEMEGVKEPVKVIQLMI